MPVHETLKASIAAAETKLTEEKHALADAYEALAADPDSAPDILDEFLKVHNGNDGKARRDMVSYMRSAAKRVRAEAGPQKETDPWVKALLKQT